MSRSPLRVVSVGVGTYQGPFAPLAGAEVQAQQVADLLSAHGDVAVLPTATETGLWTALQAALPPTEGEAAPAAVLLYWAGHGYVQGGGQFCLAGSDSDPRATALLTVDRLADFAVRTGAAHVLLVIDACYSAAGAGAALHAALAVTKQRRVGGRYWFGVLASATDWQPARDDLFGPRFTAVLRDGPGPGADDRAWASENELVFAEDLVQALVATWPEHASQQPDFTASGTPGRFVPNPRFRRREPVSVAAHLRNAALGRDPDGGAPAFTGRRELLRLIVALIRSPATGLRVLAGPAGCGKSAVLGWLACMADPRERASFLPAAAPGTDPGEGSVQVSLAARDLSPDRLVRELDVALSASWLPADRAGHRGIGELVDAVRADGRRPVIVVDGLEEAGQEAWTIASEVLRPLAAVALVLVGTRELTRPETVEAAGVTADGLAPTAAVRPGTLSGLLTSDRDQIWWLPDLVDDPADLRAYVRTRLVGLAGMDPELVADYVQEHSRDEQGRFLFARLLTSQLGARPVDTAAAGWRDLLADSAEDAFDAAVADLPSLPAGTGPPVAYGVEELLAALAWALRSGMPDDVWARVATALSGHGTAYQRSDVHWVTRSASRFLVEDGNGTQAVYRLGHQQLAEHLLGQLDDPDAAALEVARAVVGMVREQIAAGQDPESHTYLWQNTWLHCAYAGPEGIVLLEELDAASAGRYRLDLALALETQAAAAPEGAEVADGIALAERAREIRRGLDDPTSDGGVTAATQLALLYRAAGDRDQAGRQVEEAVAIARQASVDPEEPPAALGEALGVACLIHTERGAYGEAVAAGTEATTVFRMAVQRTPVYRLDLAQAYTNLALAFRGGGEPDRAVRAAEEAEELHRALAEGNPDARPTHQGALVNLALMLREAGRPDEALQVVERAVALGRELVAEDAGQEPALAGSLLHLVLTHRELAQPGPAVRAAEEAVVLASRQPAEAADTAGALALVRNALALALRDAGRLDEAERAARQALDAARAAALEGPPSTTPATVLGNLALIEAEAGRTGDAVRDGRQALTELAAAELADASVLVIRAANAGNLAEMLLGVSGPGEALEFAQQAVQLCEDMHRTSRTALPTLCVAQARLALCFAGLGRIQEAAATVQRAAVQLRPAVPEPLDDQPVALVAALATVVGAASYILGQLDPRVAVEFGREAVDLHRRLTAAQPLYRRVLVTSEVALADLEARTGNPEDARRHARAAVRELADLAAPGRDLLAVQALAQLVRAGARTGDEDAAGWADRCVALCQRLEETAEGADRDALRATRAATLSARATVLAGAAGQHPSLVEAALDGARAAVALCRGSGEASPEPLGLAAALAELGLVAAAVGRPEAGRDAATEAVALVRGLGVPDARWVRLLVRATEALARTSSSPDPVWPALMGSLPDDGTRLSVLLVRCAEFPGTVSPADTADGAPWAAASSPLLLQAWRTRAREVRWRDPAAFDAVWGARQGDRPDWLVLDEDVVRAAELWLTRTSAEQMYQVHRSHARELASPQVETLLQEFLLVSPEMGEGPHRLLEAVRTDGLDAAYTLPRAAAALSLMLSSDPQAWPSQLDALRDQLTDPAVAQWVESGAEPDRPLLGAVLRLAAAGRDEEVFGAADDGTAAVALVAGLQAEPQAVLDATAVLAELGRIDLPSADRVALRRAVALAQLGRDDEAVALAQEIATHRTLDPGRTLNALVGLMREAPAVRLLLPVFAPAAVEGDGL